MEIGYTTPHKEPGINLKEVKQMSDIRKEITKEERIDAEELAKELKKLPEAEKRKIYYMIKGAQLLIDDGIYGKKAVI